jgi:two-component system, chemotaxis family, response regulator Rcp1
MLRLSEILHVDDNPSDLQLTEMAFDEIGGDVKYHGVVDCERAFQYLIHRAETKGVPPPDLVVLDLNMPKMDGFEFLRRLRRHEELRKLPVVVLTTSRLPQDVNECNTLGIQAYFVKPSSFSDLIAIARAILDQIPVLH